MDLAEEIKGNRRYSYALSKEALEMTSLACQKLCEIPGHAQYFADEIEREQQAVEKFPTNTGPRVSYDLNRTKHFKTLSNLPSPETIAVLGHFLYDDKDKPIEVRSPGSDWGDNPRANSYGSSVTIMNIGLRNPPVDAQRRDDDPDARLAETRAWWEEIKSGKRTFSFLGQKVEYRFKPDGTWETIAMVNPADDAPRPPTTEKPAEESSTKPLSPSDTRPWGWMTAAMVALIAGLVWLGVRKSSATAR